MQGMKDQLGSINDRLTTYDNWLKSRIQRGQRADGLAILTVVMVRCMSEPIPPENYQPQLETTIVQTPKEP